MSKKNPIVTEGAPPSLGTHSQAIRSGDLVFLTGQTGRDPVTEELAEGLEAQTKRMLANIDAVLTSADCTRASIVKVTLIMADIKDFKAIDDIYREWLPARDDEPYPARTAFAAKSLPAGALVELEVVASAA